MADAVAHIATLGIDLALPQMFCRPGLTEYRALLDLLEIPYVGNAPDVMALTADRARARAVVGSAGVAVPEGEVVHTGMRVRIAPPAVVRPVDGDELARRHPGTRRRGVRPGRRPRVRARLGRPG